MYQELTKTLLTAGSNASVVRMYASTKMGALPEDPEEGAGDLPKSSNAGKKSPLPVLEADESVSVIVKR